MPTNAEISAWLAQRQVPQTPQNANIAARIMGADAIASRGGAQTGSLDASEEINRLYDQLNTRSSASGSTRGRNLQPDMTPSTQRQPTPGAVPATDTGGAPYPPAPAAPARDPTNPPGMIPSPNALGVTPDELGGDPRTLAQVLGGGALAAGGAALARRLFGGGAPPIPPTTGGPVAIPPRPGGGAPVPAAPASATPTYRGSSGGSPDISGALPAPVPVLPTPDPQLLLPAPATRPGPNGRTAGPVPLPPPPVAGAGTPGATGGVRTGPIATDTSVPRMTPPNVPNASSLGPQQSIMRVNPALPNAGGGAINPGPSPIQAQITARRLSVPAARAARAATPPGVVPRGGVGGRIGTTAPGVTPGLGGQSIVPWPTVGWHAPM